MLPASLQTFLEGHQARVVSFGLPFDHNSSHLKGTSMAPWEIKKVMFHEAHNPFSETGIDLSDHNLFMSAGVLQHSPKTWFEDIEACGRIMREMRRAPVFIGGDHSVTYPAIKGFASSKKDLTLLQIDAHPDLYDDFEGNPFSHASPFARIMENGLVKRLIQVGIRTLTVHQRDQVKRFGVECHEMRNGSSFKDLQLDGPVYMTIDMDGLDPAFAPGVSHPEPGGLTSREVINLIHRAGPNLVGGDVVEYNPNRDQNGITAIVAARLIRELARAILNNGKTK